MGSLGRVEYLRLNRVYIILVNWNGWRDTIECLESLFRIDYPDFRVVVCDNGSTDGSLARLKAWADGRLVSALPSGDSPMHKYSFPPIQKPLECREYVRPAAEQGGDHSCDPSLVLLRTGANLGFAGGNNVGIRYALARGDFSHVWLLNNDTVIDSHALTAMVERMNEKPDSGMCGSTILYYEAPEKVQALGGGCHCRWIGLPWHYGRFGRGKRTINLKRAEARMNYVEGASLLVSKPFLDDIGLMCEDYFLFFEETDWAIRAKGKYSLAYAPKSVVYHKVGGSIGTSSNPRKKSITCDYFNIRNRLFFTRKYYPYALPTIYAVLCGTVLIRMLLGQWDRVAMIMRTMVNYKNCQTSELATRSCE